MYCVGRPSAFSGLLITRCYSLCSLSALGRLLSFTLGWLLSFTLGWLISLVLLLVVLVLSSWLGSLGLLVHSVGVRSGDADEVSIEGIDHGSEVQAPHDELSLGLLDVAGVRGTGVHGVAFIVVVEVDQVPDSHQGHRDDCELARYEQSGS